MLERRECATIRAALLYWREEMLDPASMRPYLEPRGIKPLNGSEIDRLRHAFMPQHVRYAVYDMAHKRLYSTSLFTKAGPLPPEAGNVQILATVLLPID